MNIIQGLPPAPPDGSWVGIDTEMFGQEDKRLHRPTGRFACLTIATNDDDVYYITDEHDVQEALNRVQQSVWVIQNAKYDLFQWRRYAHVPPRKKLWDTMLIERTLYNGYYGSFSLASLARRHLGLVMDKETRDEFKEATSLDQKKIEYACLDAHLTRKIGLIQKKLMDQEDFWIWSQVDRPSLWAFLDFKGFGIDVDAWCKLDEYNRAKQTEIDASLPFNPRSPKQVVAWMKANGAKNIKSSDEDALTKVMEKDGGSPAGQMAQLVLLSRKYGTLASRYGMKMIEQFAEIEDEISVLYSSYSVIGAETGRTSCEHPNIQQIPVRETDAFRKCFIARPNHTLVVVDYGAQEPRLMAFASQDEYLLECFATGRDPYIALAKDAFGEEITKKDPKRKIYKDVTLGIGYGLTEHGLSTKFGISKDEALTLIKKASRILKGASAWGENQSRNHKMVKTPFGRKCWLNPYNDSCERNARNSPIQGGAADMMKRTMGRMYEDWPFPFPYCQVAMVHDETVFDFPDEYLEEGRQYVQTYMEEESTKMVGGQIKFIAEVYVGKTWAEKH